ncbi:shieldin complex subunit 2 [Kryptolebias marmoratus]|uniref:shieldin complex subunit 2 n=1 Tax=Kryptolebias marmoratus TaxID=37003 RepID=UPI0007F8CE96|nr:shieldin complex subunit 2 [Kryptolebias marmoratus]XP_017289168.1 shieldin complex subunit 2 [Kryptolebias marmoratus]XP_037829488.1 shieldin complex subunit 2 [Kryptolebias marmoratus]
MAERPKIHIFLGAPCPSSDPGSVPEAEVEGEDCHPAGWRHLELTWREGRLRPAAGDRANEARTSTVTIEKEEAQQSDLSSELKEDPTNPKSEWIRGTVLGHSEKLLSKRSDLSPEGNSDGADEDQCSALVHEYLDSCFPAAQPEPEPQELPAAPPLSTRTQYLSTWTLSQALILRGRQSIQSAASPEKTPPKAIQTPSSVSSSTPELFSPEPPSPGPSAELFSQPCSTLKSEEGGIVLQATTDGVLCSQKSKNTFDSPTKTPSSKKARISEDSLAHNKTGTARLHNPTTLLSRCDTVGRRYSVLVVVVHPCHLKEVKVKSGPSAGTFVPLVSIIVTDQSGAEMKVVLWRRAAFWALILSPGDILLLSGLQVNEDRWRGEMVLQSTFSSKLLNLGHASALPAGTQQVDARSLSSLCGFIRERRPLLVSLPHQPPQDLNRLPYTSLRALRVNTLVHALLRVTHTHISSDWKTTAESHCRSALQMKAVLVVEQSDGLQGALLLWGAALDWLPLFNRDRDAVWDFHNLLVREGLTSDLLELHSTPWSLVRALNQTDRRVQDFHRARCCQKGSTPLELDVDTLLSQKYSGEVELRVQVLAFQFQDTPPSQNLPQPVLDSSTPLDGIMAVLSGDITYTGCARCSTELDTDTNEIYAPCYPCLPHTAVRRFYRPGVLTVSGWGCNHLCVRVPPVPLQNILDAPPDKLQRSSGPGSQVKHVQVAAERIHKLLARPRKTFSMTLRSHFLCDENSVIISQDFTLLDFQFS